MAKTKTNFGALFVSIIIQSSIQNILLPYFSPPVINKVPKLSFTLIFQVFNDTQLFEANDTTEESYTIS